MTRRDRAALALALECVRARLYGMPDRIGTEVNAGFKLDSAYRALRCAQHPDSLAWEMVDALEIVFRTDPMIGSRLLRARLALLLRTLLRAESGDRLGSGRPAFGWWRCVECGCVADGARWYASPSTTEAGRRHRACSSRHAHSTRRITPAWELAPAHDSRTPRERREAR